MLGHKYKVFAGNTGGGFTIPFAVTVSLVTLGIAIALDFRHMASTRASMNELADAAALAGAKVAELGVSERSAVVLAMLQSNQMFENRAFTLANPGVTFDDDNREVTVRLDASLDMLFMGIAGKRDVNIAGQSVVGYQTLEIDPISIAFALDVSGSMGDITSDGRAKIDVLKTATVSLFDSIEDSLPDANLLQQKIRSGMTAYNTAMVDEYPMNYGWTGLELDINKLVAGGGTNSTPALQNAYDQLKNDNVKPANLRQFVIFMTDGDNNQPVWDEQSSDLCYQMRNDGIEIFSVAFNAPDKGQYLLVDCASPSNVENPPHGEPGHIHGQKGKKKGKSKGKGKGHKYGHYKDKADLDDRKEDKTDYYFDANDAQAFENAFKAIGKEIGELNIIIKS